MADQEFLASFGVEIDESGVSHLQAVQEASIFAGSIERIVITVNVQQ